MTVERWNQADAEKIIRRGFVRNLNAACITVRRHAALLISKSGTGMFEYEDEDKGYDRDKTHWTEVYEARAQGKLLEFKAKTRLKRRDGTTTGRWAKKVYGAFPSPPGSPPHKQTGNLRNSLAFVVIADQLTGEVGTNEEYGLYLELGTRRMEARPWLRRALLEMRGQVEYLLSRTPSELK